MKSFMREVIAAIKEGPQLFFAPVMAAIKAANPQPLPRPRTRHDTPSATH